MNDGEVVGVEPEIERADVLRSAPHETQLGEPTCRDTCVRPHHLQDVGLDEVSDRPALDVVRELPDRIGIRRCGDARHVGLEPL